MYFLLYFANKFEKPTILIETVEFLKIVRNQCINVYGKIVGTQSGNISFSVNITTLSKNPTHSKTIKNTKKNVDI